MKTLSTKLLLLAVVLLAGFIPLKALAGGIHLNSDGTGVNMLDNTYYRLVLSSKISDIGFTEVKTKAGIFSLWGIEGYGNRNYVGEPSLPVYRKLIEVPLGSTFSVNIVKQHYRDIDLAGAGVKFQVFPAQHPLSKSDDPDKVPFEYNAKAYSQNAFTEDPLVTVTHVGMLRSLNLARVDISPVQYNPVQNKLRVYDVLEIEIVFQNGDIPATIGLKQAKASPYFNSLYSMTPNYKALQNGDDLITSAPVTYVIVSDPMFETTLQPFIAWKKKKGFKIIEGYTNNPSVGTTTTSIKAYLQGLYNTPPAGYNVPSFVLFVGDVAQIPAWSGSAGSHYTDLRYCEYTGDNFPEVFYGRFSATSVAQLQPQIDKTIEYEQYLMPDPSFLNEVCMVAGADASFQTHSNGQINYGTETYFNAAHNITSHTYLQPEPSGANYSASIQGNVSDGVAFANYTAHCGSNGWGDPSFTNSDVPNLTNADKYCLMVGNCCLSAKFDVNSFAEEVLRAADKGAVGYIGGSNNTYWDEDFWWGCGFKTVVLHPPYTSDHIGAYDGAFHDHGEPTSDWFITQGQMVVCGDYAVEESGSSRRTYYWEIYHLMGDPSLMIYFSVPPTLSATYLNTLMIGMSSLSVTTEPYAYVALTSNGVLLDAKLADVGGMANLSFAALSNVGNLDLVITKQNRQPHMGVVQVIPASGPYVVYTSNTINDPTPGGNNNNLMDYGETNLLTVSAKNVGVEVASNVVATLSTSNSYVTITDNTENYGNIDPNQTVTRTDAFALTVAGNIPDQHVVPFTFSATNGTDTWVSNFTITANAPVLSIGAMTVQDNCPTCNNDGILDAGETANLLIQNSNSGHSSLSGISATLAIVGGSSPYLTLNSTNYSLGTLTAGGSGTAIFSVTADPSTPLGAPVDLQYNVAGGSYSAQAAKQVIIGLIPIFNMTNGTVTTCTGDFYDSGGPTGNYQNNENLTMTFYPASAGNMIQMVFTSFNTESGYDYLRIYDGTSTSATLIGTYHGTTGPGTVTATNVAGALTFNFTSDGSVTPAGWAATVSCQNASINANFVAGSTTNCVSTPVTFTDQSTGSPTSWNWTFQGGTPSTYSGQNPPQVYYYAAGTYNVSLTVSDGTNSDTETKTGYIIINPLVANFTGTPTTICTGETVTFTDNSVCNPTSWSWSFPGGTPSTYEGQNPPAITYAAAGTYDVSLTISNGTSSHSVTKTGYVTVNFISADFTGSPTTVVVGNTVTFTDNSTCNPVSWVWSFPGGTPSSFTGQNPPAITYNTIGTYDVVLTVTKPGGSDTETKTGYITVTEPNFNMQNGTITTCTGNFYDSGGSSASYQNGENYTMTFYPATAGSMIKFIFTSFQTESGFDYLRIYNGTSTSDPLIGTYHGTAGPGTVQATNVSGALTFNFTSDGSVTYAGWSASISCENVNVPPVAQFSASSTSPAINSTVTFTDLSSNIPTSWAWEFSPNTVTYMNGTTANSQNPQVQFTALGQYTVTLNATNAYGSDSEVKTNYINVITYTYCIPTYSSGTGYGDYISLVQLGSINNATGASASPYYTYYSNLSTDLTPGSPYTITLSPGTYSSGNYIAVWIDFNQNGVFDGDEKLGTVNIAPMPATGTINFTVPLTASAGNTRMRVREVWNNSSFDACSSYSYGEAEDYNVNILGLNKTLNLTVFLESLYSGSGTMRKAQNATGDQFPGTTADQITIELHSSDHYGTILHTASNVNLSTTGQASIIVPGSFSGSYYVTVKNRNAIETTTSSPVSFSSSTIAYNFNHASMAYGSNMRQMTDGAWVIYCGDVNQDGLIDSGDMIPVDNLAAVFETGYIPEDVTGDGLIDSGDMIIVDNCAATFVAAILP